MRLQTSLRILVLDTENERRPGWRTSSVPHGECPGAQIEARKRKRPKVKVEPRSGLTGRPMDWTRWREHDD